ncbi:MAG: TonB-dependent receptor, partial [Tannerellaceae bacterium]|nr:TonB-dependent receptor [Tannerellaceae bacterium]
LLGITLNLYAQDVQIKGVIISGTDDYPLPGVNVVVKGTTNGTMTDIDGQFFLNAPDGSTLVISYIGFKPLELKADASRLMNIVLQEDTELLDEVIVVGYGVQKKSVVTAAIAKISSDDLAFTNPVRVDNALKGLAAGVTVTTSSGQPNASAKVRIRGIGTINNSDPLYIIDGMPIEGGLNYLNPSDIQSIEVLKDAASGAVYGARAANGVVLITTKKGKEGKATVTYDFSMGWQNPWRERKMLNATEYAIMINEGLLNSGQEARYQDPYSYGKGTDWQKEIFNYNAPIQNHQLTISGGTEKVNYFLSAGYTKQDGIVGGNFDRSNYERLSLRSNTSYNLLDTKERTFLNKFITGINVAYTRQKSTGIETNSEYGSPLGSALAFSPLFGIYEEDQEAAAAKYSYPVRDKKNGLIYTVAGGDYNEITNPLAQLSLPGEWTNEDKLVSNIWGELTIWDNIKFRSSFGGDLAFWGSDGWTPLYYLGESNKNLDESSVWSQMNREFKWQVENTLTYDKEFKGHNIQVLLGQSAKKSSGWEVGGSSRKLIEERDDKASINFTTGSQINGDRNSWGGGKTPHALASLFARLSYSYQERYMLQLTVRRDGSSNFGTNNRFATFPSVSAGWNIANEKFMEVRPDWLTSMKLRASWGKNGNESIDAFSYVALTSGGNNHWFGTDNNGYLYSGTKPSGLSNPDLKWEESVQTDIGLDFGFLRNSLTFTVDYYRKKTNGMLMTMPIPSYVGESKPKGNVGEMENKGVEFELTYKFKVSDWNFRIGGNASYLKNNLINLGNEEGYTNYDSYQSVGTISRAENGNPFTFFYGYKTDGIFQNWAEVHSYVNAEGNLIQPNAQPGDVRFVDINGDGTITLADRTRIGKGMPDWTYGLHLNVEWKNFDLAVMLQGTIGNDIYDATRRTDISYINLPEYMLNRWTGEGTSNTIPRFSFSDENENWLSSDLYVKNGSYMRVKNVVLGYTIPRNIVKKALISNLRVYVSAENLFTFTKYDGFDPEISSGGTSIGIDRGVYPQARTFSVGLNVSF